MWCVLGWWKRVDSATVAERSWDASTAYALGTLVKFGGRSWQAMGPAYNMATPGSHAAGLSHWLMQNPVRVFDALLLCQLALVTYHALFAWGSCHWIADAAMAVLNYPGVFFILHARLAVVLLIVFLMTESFCGRLLFDNYFSRHLLRCAGALQ